MKVKDLENRELNVKPLIDVDKTLDRFKNVSIPQDKIDSANAASHASNFQEVFPHLQKEKDKKP